MREILFKARRLDNGEWVEGNYVAAEKLDKSGMEHFIIEIPTDGRTYEIDPATLCQYTGLTDKNGVKIFEGDKCRVTRTCILSYGEIKFMDGCFWFADDGPGGMLRLCDIAPNGFKVKVIGSIHDKEAPHEH